MTAILKPLKFIIPIICAISIAVVPLTAYAYDDSKIVRNKTFSVYIKRSDNPSGGFASWSYTYVNNMYQFGCPLPTKEYQITFEWDARSLPYSSDCRYIFTYDFSEISFYNFFGYVTGQLDSGSFATSFTVNNNNLILSFSTISGKPLLYKITFKVLVTPDSSVSRNLRLASTFTYEYNLDFSEEFGVLNGTLNGIDKDLENAENNAFGDITEDKRKEAAEQAGTFNFDEIDVGKSLAVSGFIHNCLIALGPEYKTLLIFSCVMGVCVFALGIKGV